MTPSYQTLISVEALSDLMKSGSPVILDCRYYLADFSRGRREFMESHIPGAYYMDIGYDLSSPVIQGITGRHPLPHPEVLTFTLRALGVNQNSQVILYDQSNGAYAARAWWLMHWLGHDQAAVLDGGWEAWRVKNLPIDNQWPPPKKGNFIHHIQESLTVEKKEVWSLTSPLVDSRDFKRFTGETEPIDPVAGHIEGAICIPYMDNTDEKGYWRPVKFLQKKFESIPFEDSAPPVFYCGSGVTACHNILAYKIATGMDARLYPGSWSEWIHYYPAVTGT